MSLKEWFGKGPKGDWVDIGAPKKKGKFQACGRKSTKSSKRKYPKCVPRSKAKRMTAAQRRSAVARKRSKAQGVGGKPTNVRTFAKKKSSTPKNKALYARVKSEAKRKFDVYPSAYANAWLVKTYKKRGGTY